MAAATILHADLDAFYASVEQLLDPSLRDVPMVVGAGVVLAASYEARAFGIRSAMPTSKARRLCPHLQVVSGSFGRYLDFSDQVMEVFGRYTPDVEQISVDEAFLQVAGSIHLFGPPARIAQRIRADVEADVGLPVSIGVATTKFLAKVASQVAKPDGLVVVPEGGELDFLHPLPIEILWGVGPATSRKLRTGGVETVGDIAAIPAVTLAAWLGPGAAAHLSALAANRDPRPVQRRRRAKSIGSQQALGRGVTDQEELDRIVLTLAQRITGRMRGKHRSGRTVSVRVRFPGGRVVSRSETLHAPTDVTDAVARVARRLVGAAMEDPTEPVTLVGVSVSGLVDSSAVQLELDVADDEAALERAGSVESATGAAIDRQLDAIRDRFGAGAVTRAGLMGRSDPNAPDDFRKLAERD